MDLLSMMPNSLRDNSPNNTGQQQSPPATQQQQQAQQSMNANGTNYPRPNRIPPPALGDNDIDVPAPNGISPANSLRRMTRDGRGSSGSVNEMGIHPDPALVAAAGLARERDRPSSRDRDRRDRDKVNGTIPADKPESRKTPTNAQGGGGSGPPTRPSPYSFDSSTTIKPNQSSTDLLSLGNPRDSPVNGPLVNLDQFKSEGAGGGSGGGPNPMQKRQGSGDTIDMPNGEHGGWISAEPSPQLSQRQEPRNPDWDRKANQAYSASRFSPDWLPLTEEQDGKDEEILPSAHLPRTGSGGANGGLTNQSSRQSLPAQQVCNSFILELGLP
jgi:hypothetical protein